MFMKIKYRCSVVCAIAMQFIHEMGYFEDKAAEKKALKGGWLCTGDVGCVDEDGFVYIKGRKKDIVIVGGKNVSMREVEEVLYSHEKVSEAIAFGVPDNISGEKIVAFLKLKEGTSMTEEEAGPVSGLDPRFIDGTRKGTSAPLSGL